MNMHACVQDCRHESLTIDCRFTAVPMSTLDGHRYAKTRVWPVQRKAGRSHRAAAGSDHEEQRVANVVITVAAFHIQRE
jgi:hypothetical protein